MFLIRESEQDNGKCWSLSILDYNDEKQRHTKHYRIRKIDSGGCFISTRNRFDSLDELVAFYSRAANGLCRTLTKPCAKVTSFVGFKDVWEEDRVNIKLGPLIGAGNFGEVYKGLWRDRFVVAIKTLKFNDQEKRNSKKEEACDQRHELESEVDVHAFAPAALDGFATGAGFDQVHVRGEELLANVHGWTMRTLEGSAEPEEVPMAWRKFAFRSYIALQKVDTIALEPYLPASLFYNLLISGRKPEST